ncbi:hypothetical protein I4U23_026140 [Adineta vaga]|nr:hypothetical protein I4U23_026140 [Adineta vaga]
MVDDNDDDVPLLDDDDEQLITSEDREPTVEAVFVATFDVKYGNIIEFQMPEKEQMVLDGVEYKALPSGSHHVNQDFVYFRLGNKYGLACLVRANITNEDDGSALSTIDTSQRGMCIKSVGIITSSIIHIQSYLPFLQAEAKLYLNQSPVIYDRLRGLLSRHDQPSSLSPSIYDTLFMEFLQQFGPLIFPLSRLILLGKRILFYSRSPIGSICNAVYFLHMLNQSVNPLFFISIMDLPLLNDKLPYIACTTEKIFKEKSTFYDVFINCDDQIMFYTNDSVLQSIIKVTRNDRNRLKKTMTFNSFINIGNRLSRLLDRLSKSTTNYQMTKEDFQSINLHSRYDRLFISEYIRIHHIPHVIISISGLSLFPISPCCSCPSTN